jgi:Domain of unknown function (DUF4386)
MNATAMVGRLEETSPRLKARITGAFCLLTILTGIFAEGFVSGRLVVDGDAAATATKILTHRGLFQLGFAVYLVEMACQIAMTALFYDLLKPAGRSVFFIVPLFVLGGAHYLSVFSAEQLQALALLFLKVNDPTEWPKRLIRGKPASSILTSEPTWIHLHNAPLFTK